MGSSTHPRHVAQVLLSELGLDVVSCTELQSLWAGYGHIFGPSNQGAQGTDWGDWGRVVGSIEPSADPGGAG